MTFDTMLKMLAGKEKKVRSFYPWVVKEEIRRVEGSQKPGLAKLYADDGSFLAIGTYNPASRFVFRVLSLVDEEVNEEFFVKRLKAAYDSRKTLVTDTDSFRWVFSEADFLPGLIIDLYRDIAVVQVRSLGMELLKSYWLPALTKVVDLSGVYEKSEMAGREEEGLEPYTDVLFGKVPDEIEICETGLNLVVPVRHGLKTGYYVDQRNSRRLMESRVKPGDRLLDCFCYTGGFSLYASRGGAKVTGVDILPLALETARKNASLNGLDTEFVEANAFEYLAEGAGGELYDWIILDPPAIAKTKEKKDSLKWGIWKLVHAAIPCLKPGGRLLVCSCSYQVGIQELIEVCRLAASDRGKPMMIEDITIQDLDHPVLSQFPESLYLKGIWVRF